MATLTVPSNLLAAGEYAVLEEGGMGLAIAVDQRVTVTIEQGEGIRIEGSWLGAVQEEFSFPAIDCSSLSYKVIEYLSEDTEIPNAENFTLSIDSSPLFHPEGTKRGYGSSAAVTVGIVAAWLYIALADRPTERVVSQIAIAAHRYAQGGKGSGYDVACSCFGSVGLFKGGGKPHWEEVPLQWTQHIYLFPGPSHVSTPAAIALYEDWKKAHREQAADFIAKSNDSVKSLCNAQTGQELTESLRVCRQIGIDLGNSIGVCAEITPPHRWIEGIHKAVGAGNELGIFATDTQLHEDLIPVDCEEIKVAEEGNSLGILTGSGSGKLLLFGEHAAVYGYEAVGITLQMSMSISVAENGANAFSGITENEIHIMESLFSFIEREVEEVQHIPVGTWSFTSTIPREAGFGSSAAVCAALSRIILAYNDKSCPSARQIWHLANRIESFFHGTPSGIDTGLSVLGGMHAFKPNPPGLPEHRPLSGSILHIVTGAVSRGSNTKDLVTGIRQRMQSGCTKTSDILRRLGDIAHTAILHLNTPGVDGQKLAESVDEAHKLLGALNLNHPDVSRCIATEKSFGALGGKISGAGNGGAFYLIYPSPTAAIQGMPRIRESLGTLTYLDAFTWRTNLMEHPPQS